MSIPIGIQRQRIKGWKMPANTVYVGRPGPYQNRYRIGVDGSAQQCVDKFRADWDRAIVVARRDRTPFMPFGVPVYLGPLAGRNLACWCALDQPCHRNVLLEIVKLVCVEEAAG